MLAGRGQLWRGQVTVYCRWLRGLGRYPAGGRTGALRHKQGSCDAPCRIIPSRQPHKKGLSGLRRWSVMVLLLGREGSGEVLEQARELARYLLRTIARQSEVHASQKLRRTLQLYSAYSRLWGEEAARNMLASLRQTLASKGRHLLLSAVCFSNFNWEQEKIADECLRESAKDLESVGALCRATVECDTCGKRQVIDQKMVNVDYCMCEGSLGYTNDTREYEMWRPFIEREHHIVWRQRHHKHNHLFAYKVYGSYDDVSLSSFMETQLNSSYRTEWDDTALQLKVLNTHEESDSDLVYWLVKFPHFFANRDYVFKRRFIVNREKREVVIMSEAVSSDVLPEEKGVHRVTEYWSTMVIRALGDVDQPGMEYTLTYFDNPGTSLPQSITNFVAVTGFPNFLKKVRLAALHLQSCHEKGEDVYVSLPAMLRYPHRWRKDLEELPEPEVPSGKELEVLAQSSDSAAVEKDIIKALTQDDLPGERQDEVSEVISPPVTSGVVEGLGTGAERLDERTHMQEELNVTTVAHETDAHIETSPVSCEEVSSLLPDAPEAIPSDKSFQVDIGGKKVSVDLLEAMEVVAPDLEKKSLLVRKMEELNIKLLTDDGKQNIILQKLQKLRHKLRSFHQQASMRKEESMKQMEQLSNRDHYHYTNIDDKTLTQLEMLFDAMRYVLQADKDMRTGKTLLEKNSATHQKAETEGGSTKKSQPADLSGIFPSYPGKDTDQQPPDTDEPVNTPNSKTSKKRKKKTQEGPPPDDPPPPHSAGKEWHDGETREEADSLRSEAEPGNFADELGNIANSVQTANSEEGEGRSWFSGASVPYISAWWEAGPRTETETAPSTHQPDITKPEHNTNSQLNAQTNTVLSQVFYMLTLRWIFYTETNEVDTQKEERSSQEGSEGGEESEVLQWYWYPVQGAYRVYTWVFSGSGVSA